MPSPEQSTPEPTPPDVLSAGPRRTLYLSLGGVFFVLAMAGIVLPVLPTTPFLLLTSYFLIRSSPRLNQRLLRSRIFGSFIRDWQRHRGVRRGVKWSALLVSSSAIAGTAYFADLPPLLLGLLLAAGAVGIYVVARLPVIDPAKAAEAEAAEE